MKKTFRFLLGIVIAIMVFVPFVKVDAAVISQKPRIVSELKSSENGIYTYEIGLNFEDWIFPTQNDNETPYCLIDKWSLYEKIGDEYKIIYSVDTSSPEFEEMYSIEIKEGEVRTFAVLVATDDNSVSNLSEPVVLEHRKKTTLYTNIANGEGCFTIIGEGLNEKICGSKNEGRKTYQLPVGSIVTVKAIPADGYEFDAWHIFDKETYKPSVSYLTTELEYSFTIEELIDDDYESISPAFVEKSKPYEVIEGAEQSVEDGKEAEFRINAEYNLFENGGEVYVDENSNPLVPEKDYTSEEGSTIIKLSKDFISTLSAGEHTLKVVFNDDNTATTSFTVTKNSSNSENNTNNNIETNTNNNSKNEIAAPKTGINNPQTGDNIMFYISLLGLSIIGLVGAEIYTKKKLLR